MKTFKIQNFTSRTFLVLFFIIGSVNKVSAVDYRTKLPLVPTPDGSVEMVGELTWNNPFCWLPYPPGNTVDADDRVFIDQIGFTIASGVTNNGRIVIEGPFTTAGITYEPSLIIAEGIGLNIGATGTLVNYSTLTIIGRISNYGTTFNYNRLTISSAALFDNYNKVYNNVDDFNVVGTLNNNEGGLIQNQVNGNIKGTGTVTLRALSNFSYFSTITQLPANNFNWIGGSISVYQGRVLGIGRPLTIPEGGILDLNGGTLNINNGGELNVSFNAFLLTEQNPAFHGKVNINSYGKLIFSGNFFYNKTDYNWESEGTIQINSTVNTPAIEVPLGAYLEISTNGVLNLFGGRTLTVNWPTAVDNKGKIVLGGGGKYIIGSNNGLLPGGDFLWQNGGDVEIKGGATLFLDRSNTVPVLGTMTNYGKINLGAGDFLVYGLLKNYEISIPSIIGSEPYKMIAADGGKIEFVGYWNALTNTLFKNLDMNPGGKVEIVSNGIFDYHGTLSIPDRSVFTNKGSLTIKDGGNVTVAAGGELVNDATLNNDGIVTNNGIVSNNLAFWNNNTLTNSGILYDYTGFVNVGTLNNPGRIGMFATFEDRGVFNNTNEINLFGTFLAGTSDVFENGNVIMPPGAKFYVMKPFVLHKDLEIPANVEFRIVNKLTIPDAVAVRNYGDFNFGTSGTGICEIQSGGNLIAFSSTTALPDAIHMKSGSYVTINEPAFVSQGNWEIPFGVTATVNGYLNTSTLLNHGRINITGKLSSANLTNASDGLVSLYTNAELSSSQNIINDGNLEANGILTGNNLKNYGTISGNGILSGTFFNYENSKIAPGNVNIGRLTFTTKQYSSGNYYPFDLGSATYNCEVGNPVDRILSPGNANLSSAELNITLPTNPPAGEFLIMSYNGHTGEFSNVTLPNSFCVDIALRYDDNALYVVVSTKKVKAFVNKLATSGNNSGLTWEDAFVELQPALEVGCPTEIWVAKGTYYPSTAPGGIENPLDPRDRTFHLPDETPIYGGFIGNETEVSSRDWNKNQTILSGDFANNDNVFGQRNTLGISQNNENAYHVLTSVNDNFFTTLDGFKVIGGNANGSGNLRVEGLDISRSTGGGLISSSSSFVCRNVTFEHNTALTSGGGVYQKAGVPLLDRVQIIKNFSGRNGGGLYAEASYTTVFNCVFSGNRSLSLGGGVYTNLTPLNIYNSVFVENASANGAAYYNLYNLGGEPKLINATITKNYAEVNGAIVESSGGLLTNSICYDNEGTDISQVSGTMLVDHSDVQGGKVGAGNMDVNPNFESIDYDGPDNIFRTSDDGLKLRYCSALIDKGIELNTTSEDITLSLRLFGVNPDMGAYENSDAEKLVISTTLNGTPIVKSAIFIEGGSKIEAPSNVTYQALNSVLLAPGFETANSTVFQASIGSSCID
ncbi:hypothetical protein SAMN06298216_4144 [Spirosomataceae bacterium TFI 002]|nr:hypothetical protein SAMN06298216_4144 [Spirosomataceae bacterium TFI 002]